MAVGCSMDDFTGTVVTSTPLKGIGKRKRVEPVLELEEELSTVESCDPSQNTYSIYEPDITDVSQDNARYSVCVCVLHEKFMP